MTDHKELPPLPESDWVLAGSANNRDAYTAGQMRDYARAAIAASQPTVQGGASLNPQQAMDALSQAMDHAGITNRASLVGFFCNAVNERIATQAGKARGVPEEPAAYMFSIKGDGRHTQLAAIDYVCSPRETILSKAPLFYAAPQAPHVEPVSECERHCGQIICNERCAVAEGDVRDAALEEAARVCDLQSVWKAWQASRAALPPVAAPGWKLVPLEPTQEMLDNIGAFLHGNPNDDEDRIIYQAMIAAAPVYQAK